MQKTLIAIGALGLAGCCVLSLLMRQLVETGAERREPPFLPALRAQFGARLTTPLRLRAEPTPTGPRWIATAHVDPETDGERLAAAIGSEVWLHAQRGGEPPSEVLVRVQVVGGAGATTIPVPRPLALR